MKAKVIHKYKSLMSSDDYSVLFEYCERFSPIERIAIALLNYIPVQIPSTDTNYKALVGEIMAKAVKAYRDNTGYVADKFQCFLATIITKVSVVIKYSVSSANTSEQDSEGFFWDCLTESYHEWASKHNVQNPKVLKSNDESDLEMNSQFIGLTIASKLIQRSDWSFLGVPSPGKKPSVKLNEELKELLTSDKVA